VLGVEHRALALAVEYRVLALAVEHCVLVLGVELAKLSVWIHTHFQWKSNLLCEHHSGHSHLQLKSNLQVRLVQTLPSPHSGHSFVS
jgi:hypothetical protein